jgi:asparagine synthase (glutamine-hydrolysing)
MCGIAGIVSFGRPIDDGTRIIDSLNTALAHRGPDGHGSYRSTDGRALLVHRRLAIIDLSDVATQPMATPDGRHHLTYNGEIYNYGELRERLRHQGVCLGTNSDTEVVLHLLQRDGPNAFRLLRGMFALAFWDERDGSLLVARDRFGIKPLYLAHTSHQIAFASEIGALRASRLVSSDVSPSGVLAYLAWSSIPAPLTWLRGVEQLEPGTWRRWSRDGCMTCGRFAEVNAAYVSDDDPADEWTLRERVSRAIRDTVRAHLVADVPVGMFLSGGIDSGAIVSTARTVSNADLHTYTVVVDEQKYSEETLARSVAERFNTRHHVLRIDAGRIERDLDAIVARLDQPTADAVNSYYVSKAVAATGIKAVMSGIGGDELFGGYPTFGRIPVALSLGKTLGALIGLTSGAATVTMPAWRAAKWRHFAGGPDLESGYRALRGFFMPEEIPELIGPALSDRAVFEHAGVALADAEQRMFTPAGEERLSASVARMETRGFLASQLLRDVDVMSMAHGLEVRVPLVDHELHHTVWPALGAHPGLLRGKRLLHDTLALPLPRALITRPKRGFTLPFDAWMRGPLRTATRDGLHALAARGWVSRSAADRVWCAWQGGQAHWSRAWGLAMLGRFLASTQ